MVKKLVKTIIVGDVMSKIDATVLKETKYIAVFVFLLSAIFQAVFLIISKWDLNVLFGNILSASASVLNFFLMGLTVQKAVLKDEKGAKATMKLSQTYRTLFLAVVLIIGLSVPCFNKIAVIIPLFFPRLAITARPFFDKK